MSEKLENNLLIVFLPQEWGKYHRRPYWEAISIRTNVLIVEPPAGVLTFLIHPRRIWNYLKKGRKVRTGKENLHFIRPLLLASPGIAFRIPFLAPIDRLLIRRKLSQVIKKLNFTAEQAVLFLVHVQQSHFSRLINKSLQCYEVTDLYTIARGQYHKDESHWYTKRANKKEKLIVSESDLIITSSKILSDQISSYHQNVHYLQNAADYKHFSKSREDSIDIPIDIKAFTGPKLGFIGNINNLIDFELLVDLANNLSDMSIILIGGEQIETGIKKDPWFLKTKSLKNIHYLGHKDYESLPAYLKAFDVCLLPFRLNDWMMHSAPNKTYQYLASGKPIVSTDFTEIRQYEEVVYVCQSHAQFVEKVRQAVQENSNELAAARQEIAFKNSTDKHAAKILSIILQSIEANKADD